MYNIDTIFCTIKLYIKDQFSMYSVYIPHLCKNALSYVLSFNVMLIYYTLYNINNIKTISNVTF